MDSQSTAVSQETFQSPGDISIDQIMIFALNGKYISVIDYLVELQLYESIFSNVLSGELSLSDSRNLIKELPIVGEELLIIKVKTPSLPDRYNISKTFKIYSIENRKIVRDQNTQIYKIKFISQEATVDSITPLFKPFKGKISDVVQTIYNDYLQMPRTYDVTTNNTISLNKNNAELLLLNDTNNNVKFVSPGWTPLQCINWLAKKSIPGDLKACTYLFWETTKNFFYGSIENLISKNITIGKYRYAATGVLGGTSDVESKMLLIQNLEVVKSTNTLDGLDTGYYSNKFVALDLYKKQYQNTIYNHIDNFSNYSHLATEPLFTPNKTISSYDRNIVVYPTQIDLFDGVTDNHDQKLNSVYANRLSNLVDLNNLKLNVTINGRTDVEVGRTIEIVFPSLEPVSEKDLTSENLDYRFSGNYLITSLNHKINLEKHYIIMEVVRDSFAKIGK